MILNKCDKPLTQCDKILDADVTLWWCKVDIKQHKYDVYKTHKFQISMSLWCSYGIYVENSEAEWLCWVFWKFTTWRVKDDRCVYSETFTHHKDHHHLMMSGGSTWNVFIIFNSSHSEFPKNSTPWKHPSSEVKWCQCDTKNSSMMLK